LTTSDANTRQLSAFSVSVYCCQFFFGGWFLFHGLNYWAGFYFDKTILPGPGLLPALDRSGLLAVVKVIEIAVSLALLADVYVPLAAVAAFPITIVIAYVNGMHLTRFGISVGVIIIALNALIALGHLDCYIPMLVANAGPPNLAGQSGPARSRIDVVRRRLTLPVHLTAIALGFASAAAVTFATLSILRK
jgi:DoxX